MTSAMTGVVPGWPDIRQIDVGDPVEGGPDGVDNAPHRDLAARTEYLLAQMATHGHDASRIVSGVIDPARIPVLPSQVQVAASGDLTTLTVAQQAQIGQGTVVTTVDGWRWVYSGAGAKTDQASYVRLADITPEWGAIGGKPASYPPAPHGHALDDVAGLRDALAVLTGIPAGMIMPWAGAGTPAGWLSCDGSAVSRTTYSALFAAIGVTYGPGDGATTFSLPDMRGRMPMGQSSAHPLGSVGGSEQVTLSEAQLPAHKHSFPGDDQLSGAALPGFGPDPNFASTTVAWDATSTGANQGRIYTTTAAGSGDPVSTLSPFLALRFVIKT